MISPILTSGVKSIRRIAAATCAAASSGRPCQSASSARLAWTGRRTGCRPRVGQRGQRPQALERLLEPAAGHGEAREQLLHEDLVDPERPDVLGPARRRSLSSQRPSRYRKSATSHRRCVPKKRISPRRSVAATPASATATASSRRPATSRIQIQFAYARPMSSTIPTSSAMARAAAHVLERRVDLAGDAPIEAPRVQGMTLDVPRHRPRERAPVPPPPVPRLLEAAAEHEDLGQPGQARARASDGGSGGIRRMAVR